MVPASNATLLPILPLVDVTVLALRNWSLAVAALLPNSKITGISASKNAAPKLCVTRDQAACLISRIEFISVLPLT